MNYSTLKKSILVTSILMVVFRFGLKAQTTFEKSYGTTNKDIGHYIELTSDNGFILAGKTGADGVADVYLMKLDASGSLEWSRIYSTPLDDQGYSVKQTADGGYIITGYILDTGFVNRMFLIKTDTSGNIEWSKIYSSSDKEEGVEVQQTPDGGYFIAGYQYNDFYFGYDHLVMRTDESGNVLWCKVYPTHNAEWGDMHLEKASTGDYYLTSIQLDVATIPLNENICVLQIDSLGAAISEKIYGDATKDERGFAVRELPSGDFLVMGSVDLKALAFRIDVSGNIVWAKKYENGYDQMEVWSFDYKPESGAAMCGLEIILPGKEDAFIFQINDNGNAGWGRVYGHRQTNYWEEAYNIKVTPDFGFVVAGASHVYGQSEWDMYVVKTDGGGSTGCDSLTALTVTNVTVPVTEVSIYDSSIIMNTVSGDFTVTEGGSELIQCAGVNSINSISNLPFTLFPNPASQEINFEGSPDLKIKEWKLFNQLGELIADQKTGARLLDVSTIPSGIYFYEIVLSGNDRIIHDKVIILRD